MNELVLLLHAQYLNINWAAEFMINECDRTCSKVAGSSNNRDHGSCSRNSYL